MFRRKMSDSQKKICLLGWAIVLVLLIVIYIIRYTGFDYNRWTLPCLLLELTGFYCPGCGGTRAIEALLHGEWLKALWYHPFVPYSAVIGGWFLISNTIEWISCGRLPIGLLYRNVYLYVGLGIIVLNFIGKNWIL